MVSLEMLVNYFQYDQERRKYINFFFFFFFPLPNFFFFFFFFFYFYYFIEGPFFIPTLKQQDVVVLEKYLLGWLLVNGMIMVVQTGRPPDLDLP